MAARDVELLDAIYAAPEDDEPRSVYADWLLERGDPRGEMIALQLARAHAAEPEMSARERELIRTYQRDWLAWVWDALYPPSVRFARGFLHAASVNVRGDRRLAERLTGDRRWRTVRALAVHDTHPHVALYTHAVLAGLDELHQVTPELLVALLDDGAPRPLRVLGLAYTPRPRDTAALAAARALPQLRELELHAYDEPLPDALAWLWTAPLGAQLATLRLRLDEEAPSSAMLSAWRATALAVPLAVHLRARERSFVLRRGPSGRLDQVAIEDHRRD